MNTIAMILRKHMQFILFPKSDNEETRRKELILNIVLTGLILLAGSAFIVNISNLLSLGQLYKGISPIISGGILLMFCALFILTRIGKSYLSASILIILFTTLGIYIGYIWGFDLPITILLYALDIVMSGILLNTNSTFLITLIVGLALIVQTYLEINGIYKPDYRWKIQPVTFGESVVYAVALGTIGIVSWLSNREIYKALKRARLSENELKKERDNLEILVEERTKELKHVQAERLAQLYRFAQLGRMTSGYFHDLVTPLSLVSFNLDRLRRQNKKENDQSISDTKTLLERALHGTKQLELFVDGARKQIQKQTVFRRFSVRDEITQAIMMLEYKARKSHITLSIKIENDIVLFGNPLKFYQLIINLVSNSIDAYSATYKRKRHVEIRVKNEKNTGILEVEDWGNGIEQNNIPHIFDPLFTTKPVEEGMGMGLFICNEIVQKDLKGKCFVKSKIGEGTTFVITFPVKTQLH